MRGWLLAFVLGGAATPAGSADEVLWPMVACSQEVQAVVVDSPAEGQIVLPLMESVRVADGTLQLSLIAPHRVEVLWRAAGDEPVGLWYSGCVAVDPIVPTIMRSAPEAHAEHGAVQADSVVEFDRNDQ